MADGGVCGAARLQRQESTLDSLCKRGQYFQKDQDPGVPATLIDLKKKGAPIGWVYLDPGFVIQTGGAAFTKAALPNAGVVFMNWFMSETGQTAFNGEGRAVQAGQAPRRPGAGRIYHA